jgi:RNA polymerase primary sigma factor
MSRAAVAEGAHAEADTLSAYLREIGRTRILSRSEERALFDRIARGDKSAYHELITANLKFVVSVCRQFQNQGLPMADLISEGNLGLIRAAQCFDGAHACRFISYAVWWIRQRILRALAEQSRFLTIPVAKAAAMRRISAAEKILAQRKGRPPTTEEVADFLSLRETEVLDLLQIGQFSMAVHEGSWPEEDGGLAGTLADGEGENPEQEAMRDSVREEIWDALGALRESEREVLRLHFGLGASRPMNLEEIGAMLGLTRAKVRKIRDDAMARLRRPARRVRFRELI